MTSVAPSTSSYRASLPPSQVSSSDASYADGSNGGFQDYMSAIVSTNAAPAQSSPAPLKASGQAKAVSDTAGTSTASSNPDPADVVTALKKLGFSDSDIATALAKLRQGHSATSKADKSGKTDGTASSDASAQAAALATGLVPVATQPQLALGFAVDPTAIVSAAEKAIAALTGQGTTAGQTAAASASQTASAATSTATSTDASAAAALLAEQGVVSVTGKIAPGPSAQTAAAATAANLHTIATQSGSPVLTNASQAASEVASATIQQATGNMPMSRMAEIRAKLQAAQLGTTKTTGAATTTTAGSITATAGTGLATAAASTATAASGGITDLGQKFIAAATAAQTGTDTPVDQQSANSGDAADQGSTDPSSLVDPSLAGINQSQTPQTQVQQATATSQAVPLTALASTLVAHAKAGDSEFNIRLDPAGLGQIDVKMKVSSDGEVRAHLIVDQPATLDLMMRDRQQLQQSLDQAGFKTDPSSLQFSLKDQGQNQGQQSRQDQPSQTSSSAAASDAALTPLQSAVYSRQSYVRADGIDLSV